MLFPARAYEKKRLERGGWEQIVKLAFVQRLRGVVEGFLADKLPVQSHVEEEVERPGLFWSRCGCWPLPGMLSAFSTQFRSVGLF